MKTEHRPLVYLAGPLFTQAERLWNLSLANELQEGGFEVLVPQVMAQEHVSTTGSFDPSQLFQVAVDGVRRADAVVAILDGADPDSGTSFECALAWASGKPIVGLRTDLRKGGDGTGNVNLMLSASCDVIVHADSLKITTTGQVARMVSEALRAALARESGSA